MFEPVTGLSGYLLYVRDRIDRGYMDPVSLSRAVTMTRRMAPLERTGYLRRVVSPPRPVSGRLRCFPARIVDANAFCALHHRHSSPVVGAVFAVGVKDDVGVRGYAIVGRPVARRIDARQTLEMTRLASDGGRNVCTVLMGGVRRHVRQINHRNRRDGRPIIRRLLTYTQVGEDGASLRAGGFVEIGMTQGGGWTRPRRPRQNTHSLQKKRRWVAEI